jgi:YjbE family integral membrane protein
MIFDPPALVAFVQVVLIDLTLAGDNAIVVALVAARVAPDQRARVVARGIAAAIAMRIGFAVLASYFLNVIGLTLAGGMLLLWVVWKLFRELRGEGGGDATPVPGEVPAQPLAPLAAMLRIVVADISMSLDNVLAVAGTARQHIVVLVAGLVLSVALMGLASTLVLRMIRRFPALIWLGLVVIAYVALRMIWDGAFEVQRAVPFLHAA